MEKGGADTAAAAAPAAPAGGGGNQCKAIYPYTGSQDDELSFEAGDVINIVNQDKDDWWSGELNGKTGVFPANYVEPMA